MSQGVCSPDHTTLSRRSRGLNVVFPKLDVGESVHVILDTTGLKGFGRGEWSSWKHGAGSKEPGWRKFHVVVDEQGRILAAVGAAIGQITADGGHDRQEVYDAASRVGAKVVIPPMKDAVPSRDPTLAQRNQHIEH
ncbi:MAG: hypothetical protein ACI9MC_003957 [Kiritimatiellia bacterium]|jgi:hypothetical protein